MPNPGLYREYANGRAEQPQQHAWQLSQASAWLLCALLELAVSFLLWSAAMASFVASKFFQMIGLHPPFFFSKFVVHRLSQQGSFVLDHVAQELCMLSHRVLHRNYTHDKSVDSFPYLSFSSRYLETANPTERHSACTNCLYKCYSCVQPRSCAQNRVNVAMCAEVPSPRPTVEHSDSASRCSFRKRVCSSSSLRKSSFRGYTKKMLDQYSFSLPDSCESLSAMSASSKHSRSTKVFPVESMDYRVSSNVSDDSVTGYEEAETSEIVSKGNNKLEVVDINGMTALVSFQSESSEEDIGEEKSRHKHNLASKNGALDEIYLELEKERTAAASAASEAMAMIAKLQKEKAALHMEAMQYQRIAEEKALCDEEAIDILRNLLLKEEEEKTALKREIELYRKRLLKDEQEGAEHEDACSKSCDVFSWQTDMENLTLAQTGVEGIDLETQFRKEAPVSALPSPNQTGNFEPNSLVEPSESLCAENSMQGQQLTAVQSAIDLPTGIFGTELGAAELRKEDSGRDTNLYREGHWQHLIERICKLEKNITVMKENLDMNVMQATAQFSSHSDIKDSIMQAHKREEALLYIASGSSDQTGLCNVIPQLVECKTSGQETVCLSSQSHQLFEKNKGVCNDSGYCSSSAEEVAQQLRLLQASEAKLKALDITSQTSEI